MIPEEQRRHYIDFHTHMEACKMANPDVWEIRIRITKRYDAILGLRMLSA